MRVDRFQLTDNGPAAKRTQVHSFSEEHWGNHSGENGHKCVFERIGVLGRDADDLVELVVFLVDAVVN